MAFYRLVFVSLCIILIASCKQRNESATISMEVPVEIPAGLNTLETHVFRVIGIPTFYNTTLSNAGIDESEIVSILSGFGAFRQGFSNVNLDFILGITVHALLDPITGERRELFYLEQIPLGQKDQIQLLATTTELKEVLNKESIDLELSFRFRDFSPQTFTGVFDLEYGVYLE